jgi:hypothetical protein
VAALQKLIQIVNSATGSGAVNLAPGGTEITPYVFAWGTNGDVSAHVTATVVDDAEGIIQVRYDPVVYGNALVVLSAGVGNPLALEGIDFNREVEFFDNPNDPNQFIRFVDSTNNWNPINTSSNVPTVVGAYNPLGVVSGATCFTPSGAGSYGIVQINYQPTTNGNTIVVVNCNNSSLVAADQTRSVEFTQLTGTNTPSFVHGSSGTHYFIDWMTKTFWPVVFGSRDLSPTAMLRYAATPTSFDQVVFGCYDGKVRYYSADANSDFTDQDVGFISLISYGPLRLGGSGYNGQLVSLAADFDPASSATAWGIYSADNAEDAVNQLVLDDGTGYTNARWQGVWGPGRNTRQYPRARDAAIILAIVGNTKWAVEEVRIEAKRRGALR